MGLAENVSALATRVATEVKAVRSEVATALRTKSPAPRRWTDWRTRASGQTISNTTVSDDGTVFLISNTAGSESAATANGRLEVSWANSAGGALYVQQNTGGTIKRIGASFGFGPSANATSGSFALATWTTDFPTAGTTAAQIHLAITASSATFGVVVAGTVTNLVTWTFATPLLQDWTPYYAEVIIIGSTAFCSLPDGGSQFVTDSRIGSTQGYTAVWEFFRDANTTTVPLAFYSMWASPSIPVTGSASPAMVARSVGTAIVSYRAEDAMDNYGNFNPSDHGMGAWTFDALWANATLVPGTGIMTVSALKVDSPISCSLVGYGINSAGATFTASRNYLGLYDAAGNLLRQTADMATPWASIGFKTQTWTAGAITLPAGQYYVGAICTATTRPGFASMTTNTTVAQFGRSVTTLRSYNTTATYTALPATRPNATGLPASVIWFGLG